MQSGSGGGSGGGCRSSLVLGGSSGGCSNSAGKGSGNRSAGKGSGGGGGAAGHRAHGWEDADVEFYKEAYPVGGEGNHQQHLATLLPSARQSFNTMGRGTMFRPRRKRRRSSRHRRHQPGATTSLAGTTGANATWVRTGRRGSDTYLEVMPDLTQGVDEEQTWLQLQEVRCQPVSMREKRALKHSLLSLPTLRSRGWDAVHLSKRKLGQRLKSQFKELMTHLELWRVKLRHIEGNFGTGLVALFTFIKWLIFLNLFMTVFILLFIVTPNLFLPKPSEKNCTNSYLNSSLVSYLTPNTAIRGVRELDNESAELQPLESVAVHADDSCCHKLYEERVKQRLNRDSEKPWQQSVVDIVIKALQGSGELELSPVFYGFYSKDMIVVPLLNDDSLKLHYNFPLSYVSLMLLLMIMCLVVMVKKAARGLREMLRSTEGEFYMFSNLVFGGWDFCIENMNAACVKQRAIYNELSSHLDAERFRREKFMRTRRQRITLVLKRVLINLLVLSLLAGCFALVFYVTLYSFNQRTDLYKKATEGSETALLKHFKADALRSVKNMTAVSYDYSGLADAFSLPEARTRFDSINDSDEMDLQSLDRTSSKDFSRIPPTPIVAIQTFVKEPTIKHAVDQSGAVKVGEDHSDTNLSYSYNNNEYYYDSYEEEAAYDDSHPRELSSPVSVTVTGYVMPTVVIKVTETQSNAHNKTPALTSNQDKTAILAGVQDKMPIRNGGYDETRTRAGGHGFEGAEQKKNNMEKSNDDHSQPSSEVSTFATELLEEESSVSVVLPTLVGKPHTTNRVPKIGDSDREERGKSGIDSIEESVREAIHIDFIELIYRFLPTVTIVALNVFMPVIFRQLVVFEQYNAGTVLRLTLLRTVALRLMSLGVLLFALHNFVKTCNMPSPGQCTSSGCAGEVLCWETYVGQELYKLSILDLLVMAVNTFIVNFTRKILGQQLLKRYRVGQRIGAVEFEIPKHVLDIVYGQTLCWLGMFYAPLLPAITAVKLVLVFYIKYFDCSVNGRQSSEFYRTSRSNSLFITILLFSFIVTMIPVGYSVMDLTPSLGCGPFRGRFAIWDEIILLIASLPSWIQSTIFFFGTAGFTIPSAVLLGLAGYYYYAVASVNKHLVQVLKGQLILEGHDKQFLLTRLDQMIKEMQQHEDVDGRVKRARGATYTEINGINDVTLQIG